MKFTVYALRVVGTHEVRYVGQTRRTPAARLLDHHRHAQNMPLPSNFARWLMANDVEVIALDECDTEFAAKCLERAMIAAAARMDQRLFNTHHVPAAQHINRRTKEEVDAFFTRHAGQAA